MRVIQRRQRGNYSCFGSKNQFSEGTFSKAAFAGTLRLRVGPPALGSNRESHKGRKTRGCVSLQDIPKRRRVNPFRKKNLLTP